MRADWSSQVGSITQRVRPSSTDVLNHRNSAWLCNIGGQALLLSFKMLLQCGGGCGLQPGVQGKHNLVEMMMMMVSLGDTDRSSDGGMNKMVLRDVKQCNW
jgi:hypothetical protein